MITWFGWALVVGLEQAGSSPTPQAWLPILPHGRVVTGTITKARVWGKKTNGTDKDKKKMVYLVFVYCELSPHLHAESDQRLLRCLSYFVWLMVLPYCSHSHRSISLVPDALDHDHLARAQKAKVDVQTSWPSWAAYGFGYKMGQAPTACLQNIQCKALFRNGQENARRCARQGRQRHAVPSEEQASNLKTSHNNPGCQVHWQIVYCFLNQEKLFASLTV